MKTKFFSKKFYYWDNLNPPPVAHLPCNGNVCVVVYGEYGVVPSPTGACAGAVGKVKGCLRAGGGSY